MISLKTEEEIEAMRRVGRVTAEVLDVVCAAVVPGVSTLALDQIIARELKMRGAKSACLGCGGRLCPFPANACFSINDEVVHGIPSSERKVCEGDILSIDLVACLNGFMGDSTRTVAVGSVSPKVNLLLKATEAALRKGIAAAVSGNRVGDISAAIEECAKESKLSVVRELVGHGIGREMHEEPSIPNWGQKGTGPLLKEGMTLAIEPMFLLGSDKLVFLEDGWTVRTADGEFAAHFEHTIAITKNDPEILTASKNRFRSGNRDCGWCA
jgi:methionyl aminopeptidase